MKTNRVIRISIQSFVVGFLLVGTCPVGASERPNAEKPNIVLYIADDHGRNDSSVYDSNSDAITPSMAKLASEGLTFNNAFVASPACGPSRSALMSGRWPAKNGGEHNHERPRPATQSMIKHIKAAGYEVARFKYIRNIHSDAYHTTHTDMQRRPDHGSFFTEWEAAAKTDGHAKAVIEKFHRRPAVEFYDIASDPGET